jgi:hypothetical protein
MGSGDSKLVEKVCYSSIKKKWFFILPQKKKMATNNRKMFKEKGDRIK